MLLSALKSQLLIVDVQERLAPTIHAIEDVKLGCRHLLQASKQLKVPALLSEQYPKGLGVTVSDITHHADHSKTFDKITFSCLGDKKLATTLLANSKAGRNQIIVAGIEAHICVLQTCLQLRERGFEVAVVADAVSSRKRDSVDLALSRMAHEGIMLVTVEMVLFEWLERAGTETFKAISALIK